MALFENITVGKLVAGNDTVTIDGAAGTITTTGGLTTGAVSGTTATLSGTTIATGVTCLLKDGAGKALLCTGTTVPSDTGALYAKGCLFIDTDVATGTTGLYVNVGTSSSCVFKAVSNA